MSYNAICETKIVAKITEFTVDKQPRLTRASAGPIHTGYGRRLRLNPFKPNGIFQSYQLDRSISVLRDVGWYFSFLFKF